MLSLKQNPPVCLNPIEEKNIYIYVCVPKIQMYWY